LFVREREVRGGEKKRGEEVEKSRGEKLKQRENTLLLTLSVRPRLLSSSMAGAVNASEFLVR
jgi:hypothetical protein